MMRRWTTWLAAASLVLSLGLLAAALALASTTYGLTFLPLALVGALLAWRRPANVVGWLLSSFGMLGALNAFAQAYATRGLTIAPGSLPAADVMAWLQSWEWAVYLGILSTTFLLFPSGQLPSPRWRSALAATWVLVIVICIAIALFSSAPDERFSYRNPYAVAILWDYPPFLPLLYTAPSVGAISLLVRARRARADERQQLKLVGFAVAVFAFVVLVGRGALQSVGSQVIDKTVGNIIFYFASAGVPLSIGMAILRYRLYDIDVVIRRSLVYGATTAGIAAAFFTGIVVLEALLRPLTSGSELAVAASTLASVALFQPLRSRVQQAVDRRFYRSRYDAARTLDEFSVRLRDQVALDAVRADLLDAVRDTMQPTHAGVWLRERAR